jgi:hypothetical protein
MAKNDTVVAGFSFFLVIGALLVFLLTLPVKADRATVKFNSAVTHIFTQPGYVVIGKPGAAK